MFLAAALKQRRLQARMGPSSSQLYNFTMDLDRYLQNLEYDHESDALDPIEFWKAKEKILQLSCSDC